MFKSMFTACGGVDPRLFKAVMSVRWAVLLFSAGLLVLLLPNSSKAACFLLRRSSSVRWLALMGGACGGVLFLACLKMMSKGIPVSPFLYFQF